MAIMMLITTRGASFHRMVTVRPEIMDSRLLSIPFSGL